MMVSDTAAVPGAHGRWISQSSAEENLGLLSSRQMNQLRQKGSSRRVAAGAVVASAGKHPTHVQVVCNGELELMTRLPTGRVTMALVRGGGVISDIPMLLEAPMPFDAVASRDSELILLSRNQWMQLLTSHPAICLKWMQSVARRLEDDRRRLVVVTTRPLIAQLAYVLIDLAEPEPGGYPAVRLSHTTVAQLIGARAAVRHACHRWAAGPGTRDDPLRPDRHPRHRWVARRRDGGGSHLRGSSRARSGGSRTSSS
jgi:CRP-like cAMP-binding protein